MVRMKKTALANPIAAQKTSSDAVEAYIAAVSEPTQTTLRRLREIILSAVPTEAVEVISYGIPAFSLNRPFFGYAAFATRFSSSALAALLSRCSSTLACGAAAWMMSSSY